LQEVAILAGQVEVVQTILAHKRWEDAMNKEQDASRLTPMKLMIRYMPEAALQVLNVRSGYQWPDGLPAPSF
jgi:hypothetical protein